MSFLDKRDVLSNIKNLKTIILDLGCGPGKKKPTWIGIDVIDYDCVDIVGDIYEVLNKFPDETVDEIHAYHFFEHLSDFPRILSILQRIIKPHGEIVIVVPHFSNPYYFSDYTHKAFFGLYSLSYLSKDDIFKRKVPNYNVELGLKLKTVKLYFKSPFLFKLPFKKFYQFVFNLSNGTKEFYEESLCYTFPCYEIEYILGKNFNK